MAGCCIEDYLKGASPYSDRSITTSSELLAPLLKVDDACGSVGATTDERVVSAAIVSSRIRIAGGRNDGFRD